MNLADAINLGCACQTLQPNRLREQLETSPALGGLSARLAESHPHLFSASAVFLDPGVQQQIVMAVQTLERVIALPAWWLLGKPQYPTSGLQWGILLWLGVGASGLGYFLWNKGATLVTSGVLAIMNNALIPAGLLVNLLIWNHDADLLRLALGGAVIAASLPLVRLGRTRRAPAEVH